jgi:hypothetical protein
VSVFSDGTQFRIRVGPVLFVVFVARVVAISRPLSTPRR